MRIEDIVIRAIISGEASIRAGCKVQQPHRGNCFGVWCEPTLYRTGWGLGMGLVISRLKIWWTLQIDHNLIPGISQAFAFGQEVGGAWDGLQQKH